MINMQPWTTRCRPVALLIAMATFFITVVTAGEIHEAAGAGEVAIVRTLLNQNPKLVNEPDRGGLTPLHWAAGYGVRSGMSVSPELRDHLATVELLLQYGAEVDALDGSGSTPLAAAADAGQLEISQLLVKHGARVNNGNYPPLHTALFLQHHHLAEWLIAHGADISSEDVECLTPLLRAIRSATSHCGETVTEETKEAAANLVRMLLEKGANPNQSSPDNDGWMPLNCAVRAKAESIIELLMEYQANPRRPDKRGDTPLLLAIREPGYGYLADYMCRHDEEVDIFVAAARGLLPRLTTLLIAQPALRHATDSYQLTALHYAAMQNQYRVAEVLLHYGAAVNASAVRDVTPLYIAAMLGHTNLVGLLLANGADVNGGGDDSKPLWGAVRAGHKDVVHNLLRYGADSNALDSSGQPPLHIAAAECHLEILQALLFAGAKINATNGNGQTALHRGSVFNQSGAIEALLAAGADPNVADKTGTTPLHLVARRRDLELISQLLAYRAKVDLRDHRGKTALMIAEQDGNVKVAELLAKATQHQK